MSILMSISKLIIKSIRIFDGIINFFAVIAAILILFLTASVLYGIAMRYFIGRAERWTFEITEYTLLFIIFLATAWLLKEEGHVKMDVLLVRLKPRNQALINTVTSIIFAVMFLILTWYSAGVVVETYQKGFYWLSELKPPMAPILSIIPIGSFLLFIQFLRRAYGYLESLRAT